MNICLASSVLEIAEEDALALHKFIDNESELYTGKFDNNVSYALDCFEFSVDKTRKYPKAHNISIIEITPKVGEWEATDVIFLNNESSQKINISDKIEGEIFENTICGALTSVFPKALYKGLQVEKGDKVREFTDVFAYYEHGSFLIEAKDLYSNKCFHQF